MPENTRRPINGNPPLPPRQEVVVNNTDVAQQIISLTDDQLKAGIWTNLRSGNIYKVVRIEGSGLERRISYVRVGASEGFNLSIPQFSLKFRFANQDELFQALVSAMRSSERETDENGAMEVGLLVNPDHRHDFDRIILFNDTIEAIRIGIHKVVNREQLEEVWGLSQIEPRSNRSVLNFYGPPGTGKTLGALAVAKSLGKKVYQVDYASIISKYVGDTAKYIKAAFHGARRHNAVLFWDEADSLMSKRVSMSGDNDQAFSTSVNQNRNVLMQEMDRFDGVIVMATNFFHNFDEAILRRIAQHVPFRLPNVDMKVKLFKLHIPRHERVGNVNWDEIAAAADNFSGGDILNACINAITRCSMDSNPRNWNLTHDHLLREVELIAEAKRSHARNRYENING